MPGTLDRRTFISRSAAVAGGSVLRARRFSPSGRTLFFNLFGRANFSEEPVEA